MSHEVETMAYAGEVPWHGLGVPVNNDLTPEEMLKAANLDWEVKKVPMEYSFDDDGTVLEVPNKFALVRATDGNLFDIVGPGWRPLQNEDAFELFNDFVKQGDMEMHTAGSLKDGQIVWALAKMNNTFEVSSGDAIEQYLLLVNPHKRGKAIEVMDTDIRVVCRNTMNFALKSHSTRRIKVNHNQHRLTNTSPEYFPTLARPMRNRRTHNGLWTFFTLSQEQTLQKVHGGRHSMRSLG